MKKMIVRLTESDLHRIIKNSVDIVLREQNDDLFLKTIAQKLSQKQLNVNPGNNEERIDLGEDTFVCIDYNVQCDPYQYQGRGGADYDEVIDNPEVEVTEISLCEDGDCRPIQDNGIIKKVLEMNIVVDYSNYDIPSKEDFFYNED